MTNIKDKLLKSSPLKLELKNNCVKVIHYQFEKPNSFLLYGFWSELLNSPI